MEQEETPQSTLAICRNCGHTWEPRNPNAKNPKCSKCGSTEIAYESGSSQEISEDPTPEQIAALINQQIEPDEPEEEIAELEILDETKTEKPKLTITGFKVHPALLFICMAAILSIGTIILFRRRSKKQSSSTFQEPQEENEQMSTLGHTRIRYFNETA